MRNNSPIDEPAECTCSDVQVLLSNPNSVVFLAAGRLVLQDKTHQTTNELFDSPTYESKWISLPFCPFCGRPFHSNQSNH